MKKINQGRMLFAVAVTMELHKLESDSRKPDKARRLNWLLAGLRAHPSESILDVIKTAEELYTEEVNRTTVLPLSTRERLQQEALERRRKQVAVTKGREADIRKAGQA